MANGKTLKFHCNIALCQLNFRHPSHKHTFDDVRCACVEINFFLFFFVHAYFCKHFKSTANFHLDGNEFCGLYVRTRILNERNHHLSQLYSNVREDAINNNWHVWMFVFHSARACATSWSIHLSKKMRWRIHVMLCFVNAHLNLHLHFRLFLSDVRAVVCVYVSKSHKTEIPLNWWTKQTHQ